MYNIYHKSSFGFSLTVSHLASSVLTFSHFYPSSLSGSYYYGSSSISTSNSLIGASLSIPNAELNNL